MSELGGLDERINIRGEIESLRATLTEREKRVDAELRRLEQLFAAKLQEELNLRLARRQDDLRAIEKAEQAMNKRLDSMNELREQLNDQARRFVSSEKFDDNLQVEKVAREAALLRVDEKFDDYVKRYEQDKRDIQIAMSAQKAATDSAERTAEKFAQEAKDKANDQARRTNKNLQYASVFLAIVVVSTNILLSNAF